MSGKTAVIAMSGGVDSSVSALLMVQAGYDCIGATMRLFDNPNNENTCGSANDAEDARGIAQRLNMPFYILDFKEDFKHKVISNFITEYKAGRTPNPCVDCNRHMKFGAMFDYMQAKHKTEYIVTGHYVRVAYDEASKRYLLKKGLDATKDQSYVLYMLTQNQLAHVKFPLGEITKAEVREIAEKNGFINANKRDSQDICFVPDGDYAAFIQRCGNGYIGKAGDFITTDGRVLGKHKGIINYTIGQRKGLGISADRPLYVCKIDTENNTVMLGDNADLMSYELIAEDVNLIPFDKIEDKIHIKARVRYNQPEQPATVWQEKNGDLHVKFDAPQRAITLGQAVVLYDGENVVGGGTIKKVL